MKKLAAIGSAITSIFTPITVLAQSEIKIERPTVVADGKKTNVGYTDIGNFISNILTVAFIFAVIVVLFMLIWGSYEWITSGGDKEAVGKARNRILNALIGIAVLAVAFALAQLGAQILGFPNLLQKITIPSPNP